MHMCLITQVCLGTILSVAGAQTWLDSTFLRIRLMRNPSAYKLPKESGPAAVASYLHNLALMHVFALHSAGCVKLTTSNTGGTATHGSSGNGGGMQSTLVPSAAAAAAAGAAGASATGGGNSGAASGCIIQRRPSHPMSIDSTTIASVPFAPVTVDELRRESDSHHIEIAPLTPAFVMSRNYLRFATLRMFPNLRECGVVVWSS